MSVSRRNFLQGMGALGGIAATAAPLSAIATAARDAEASAADAGSGRSHIKSTCCHCVNFCGIDVEMENGVVRNVLPDRARADFFNIGLCPKGPAGVFNAYNPYRIKAPLKRTNSKKGLGEDPGWVEISWEEAFDTIATRLKAIRADDPRKLIWQHGHGKYLIGDKFPKAFAAAFGTPNLVHRTTTCEAARHVADELTWGYHGFLPDLDHCRMLLNFGGNYFEGEQWSRWLDHSATDAKERGMKVVAVEPRMSHVAGKADQWIPVRPGKDAVLMLAMAKTLIDEGLIDEVFLKTYTNAPNLVGDDGLFLRDAEGKPLVWDIGSASAKPYSGEVLPALKGVHEVDGKPYKTAFQVFTESLEEITPEYTEETTGVAAALVHNLAVEFGKQAMIGATVVIDGQWLRYRPVAVHTFRGLSAKEFGVQNWRMGLILQMLVGSIDAVGGINLHSVYKKPHYLEPSKCEYPPHRVDLQESVFFPHSTHNVCQQVALTLRKPETFGLEYVPEMQIIYATNRPFSTSDTAKQFEGLTKTFNVVIDLVMTETAEMADIVLPDLTFLEAWHLSPTRYTPTTKHTAIRQPVINVYNLPQEAYSIIWELAKRVGIRDEYIKAINKKWKLKKFPMDTERDYSAREAVELLWKEQTHGKSFHYAVEHAFLGKRLGVKDTYLKGVEAKFKGPDQPKMHFYAEQLVGSMNNVRAQVEKYHIGAIDLEQYAVALAPLPGKEHAFPTPHREAQDYPFYLITYKSMYRNQSGNTSTNPILNRLGPDTNSNFVLLNRATAKELGVDEAGYVVIETRVGKVKGKVKLTEGIRPDTVAVSYNYGQQSADLPGYAKKGIWINQVMELHPDKISGMNSFNDTKCKVYGATRGGV